MGVILVYDENLIVHDVRTFTSAAPYGICAEGGRALESLKGLRIASGWSKEVRSRLSGAATCTHLMEILAPMATAAYQSLGVLRLSRPEPLDAIGPPIKIDSCYAYGAEREIVRRRWPEFSRPPAPAQNESK